MRFILAAVGTVIWALALAMDGNQALLAITGGGLAGVGFGRIIGIDILGLGE